MKVRRVSAGEPVRGSVQSSAPPAAWPRREDGGGTPSTGLFCIACSLDIPRDDKVTGCWESRLYTGFGTRWRNCGEPREVTLQRG
jgi:hypothetical protein